MHRLADSKCSYGVSEVDTGAGGSGASGEWGLTVNVSKTKAVTFKNGAVYIRAKEWKYGEQNYTT